MTKELESLIRYAADALLSAGAKQVYLFGSVARGKDEQSGDIDLAVCGLPPERFFKAMGKARRILQRPIDLVDLDVTNPFTAYLKESGELKRVA